MAVPNNNISCRKLSNSRCKTMFDIYLVVCHFAAIIGDTQDAGLLDGEYYPYFLVSYG